MDNNFWLPRWILEDVKKGSLRASDLGIYTLLMESANPKTGVCLTTTDEIRSFFYGRPSCRLIQASLTRLQRTGWIKIFRNNCERGVCAIVMGNYVVPEGSLGPKQVNLAKTVDWQNVQFDLVNDPAVVAEWIRASDDIRLSFIQ